MCGVLLVGQIANKRFRGPVEAVEAMGGTDPQFAITILVDDMDDVTAETRRILLVSLIPLEGIAITIIAIKPFAPGSNP